MITDDDHVAQALAVLRDGQVAEDVTYQVTVKEYLAKKAHAQELLLATGTVAEKDAKATVSKAYEEAMEELAQAKAQKAKYEHEREGARETCNIWRTENANARAAERVR